MRGLSWYRPIRPAALGAVTVAVVVLGATGVLPRWPGLIHLVALPPFDLITDLRILMVVSPSYPVFVAGLALSLAIRVTVLAFLLGGLDRRRLGYAARYYLVVLPPSLVAVALLLGAGATLYYGLFWAGLVAVLITVALTAGAAWSRPPRLAAGFAAAVRHGLRLGTVGAYLVALAGLGVVADLTGPAGTVALVPVSALLTLTAARLLRADPALHAFPAPGSDRSTVADPLPRRGTRGARRPAVVGLRLARWAVAGVGAAGIAALVAVVVTGPAGPPRHPCPTPRAAARSC